jgi:SAM-dependent methyltransferase
MFFDYHTTTSDQRETLMQGPFEWIHIDPEQIIPFRKNDDRGRSVVWLEHSNDFVVLDHSVILKTLQQYDSKPWISLRDTEYWTYFADLMGDSYCESRIKALFRVYHSVRQHGLDPTLGSSGGICVEATGERLDGKHRAIIAYHLSIAPIPVKLFRFDWRTVDEAFLRRKLRAREVSFGPCYYAIDYGPFESLEREYHRSYRENAHERWDTLLDTLITPGESILDIGCNEGFNSIQAALKGCRVVGIDRSYISGAWLNKLIYEWVVQRDLAVSFVQADVDDVDLPECDTALVLNLIYHLPNHRQIPLLRRLNAKRVILQGNLRKLPLHEHFRGITVQDMIFLLGESGYQRTDVIEWRDKPLVVGYKSVHH